MPAAEAGGHNIMRVMEAPPNRQPWHSAQLESVVLALNGDALRGLSASEADKRLALYSWLAILAYAVAAAGSALRSLSFTLWCERR